jgi:PAS domain S-box-containing protein
VAGRSAPGRAADLLLIALLASAYVAGAGLGFLLAPAHQVVSSAWPPAGIALAALWLYGRRLWPGVAAGAFLANFLSGLSPALALTIAAGNTLEALVAVWLLRRLRFHPALERLRDVITLVIVAAAATIVSASVGVPALWLAENVTAGSMGLLWLTWWTGDAIGILIVGSLLLAWKTAPPRWPPATRAALEAVALVVALGVVTAMVVAIPFSYVYPVFPVAGLAAFRLGARGATAANLTVAGVAAYYTIQGVGAFGLPDLSALENVFLFQAFVALLAVTTLTSAAVLTERRQAEADLRASELRLSEAQAAGQMGSWTWDPATGGVSWSDELYRLFGVDRLSFRPSLEAYLDRVHPDDREQVQGRIRHALETRTGFQQDERIIRSDGAVRTLDSRARFTSDGRQSVLVGICQDVTDLRRAQETLAASEAKFATLFQASPVAICVIARESLAIIDANARFFDMVGRTDPHTVFGASPRDLGMWAEPGELRDVMARLRVQGSIRETPVKYLTRDGHERRAVVALELIRIGGVESVVALFWRP